MPLGSPQGSSDTAEGSSHGFGFCWWIIAGMFVLILDSRQPTPQRRWAAVPAGLISQVGRNGRWEGRQGSQIPLLTPGRKNPEIGAVCAPSRICLFGRGKSRGRGNFDRDVWCWGNVGRVRDCSPFVLVTSEKISYRKITRKCAIMQASFKMFTFGLWSL
jgi:hypothetical protein